MIGFKERSKLHANVCIQQLLWFSFILMMDHSPIRQTFELGELITNHYTTAGKSILKLVKL